MAVTATDVIQAMEKIAPPHLAYEWDNVGLLAGDEKKVVARILVALDATEAVIEEAVQLKADMLLTHHPLIFRPVKCITTQSSAGRRLIRIIQNDLCLYAAHTNFDLAKGGTNAIMAEKLGLAQCRILHPEGAEALYKLAVHVPVEAKEKVSRALFSSDAGHLGNYSRCSFYTEGTATFLTEEGANPYKGKVGEMAYSKEVCLETIVKKSRLNETVQQMLEAHPYEEVAYDIYPVLQKGEVFGLGRIGRLEKRLSFQDFADRVKAVLKLDYIQMAGRPPETVEKVALVTGAGIKYIEAAKSAGADIFITSDVGFHDAQDAIAEGLCILDGTHYATEAVAMESLVQMLDQELNANGKKVDIMLSKVNGQTFSTI